MLMMAMYDEVVGISLVLIVEVPGFTWCLLCRIGLLLVVRYNLHLIVKFRVCRLSGMVIKGRKNRQKKVNQNVVCFAFASVNFLVRVYFLNTLPFPYHQTFKMRAHFQ